MTRGIRVAVVFGVGSLVAACLTAPAETESTSEVIARDAGPIEPPLCERTPSCSMTSIEFSHPLQKRLHCGETTEYFNGYSGGFMGGIGSFCPDSEATRTTLRGARIRAYQPGFCTQCLVVPEGSLYVLWSEFEGPGCPSSCNPGSPPERL